MAIQLVGLCRQHRCVQQVLLHFRKQGHLAIKVGNRVRREVIVNTRWIFAITIFLVVAALEALCLSQNFLKRGKRVICEGQNAV